MNKIKECKDKNIENKFNITQKNKLKELKMLSKGITLISLVITIIVLIILAGVTITTLIGDNGILTKASDTKEQKEIAEEIEKIKLSVTGSKIINNGGELTEENLKTELGKYYNSEKYNVTKGKNTSGLEGYIVIITENIEKGRKYFVDEDGNVTEYINLENAKPTPGTGNEFEMKNGVIEVTFLDGTTYNTTDIPNHPVLKNGIVAITYDEDTGEISNVNNSNTTDWYSYLPGNKADDNNSSHWANAKLTVNNIDSYFVWIPRYAYRIIYFDSKTNANKYRAEELTEEQALEENLILGYSDARGIVDSNGRTKKGVSEQTAISVNDKFFKTHPVFDGNADYGGWTKNDGSPAKLQGIWVSKFEASQIENSSTPKFEPGVNSWIKISIGNMFTNAKNYNTSLNSHLMKNSEWGAVAYLTDSTYGRNGTELTPNNNEEYYTGGGMGNAYVTNVNQSSTGNIYGIYDLSGNAFEFVAVYFKQSNNLTNANSFAIKNGTSNAFSTVYDGNTQSINFKYGDATYETSGWNLDDNYFIDANNPFFGRGGDHKRSGKEGLFNYGRATGSSGYSYGYASFRVCLIV